MRMRRALAAAGVALAIVGGTDACRAGSANDTGYVDEVQYGYYDPGYHDAAHYHYYSHPKTVRVTKHYYTTHRYEYTPHGTQKRVTIHKTTTTTTTHHSSGTTTRRTTRTTTRSSTTRSSHH